MRRALNVSVLIAVIALVVPCAQADDGMTITSKVTAAMGGASTSTQYITSDKIRISDGETDMIVDLKAGKMIQIDHKKKKYFEITFEEMRQHFEKMEQMIASTPMMEKMMGGKLSEVEVEKTSESREILGYDCTKYILNMGGSFSETLWVTPDLEMPLEYYDASKMMYASMGPMAARFEKMLESIKEIDGFPLATDVDIKVMGKDASSSSEVTDIKNGPIPADLFTVPAGYKKKKSPYEQ